MANTYINAVTGHSSLKASIRLLALILANRANDTGTCWPSIKTLSQDTNSSASTVKRGLAVLKDSGYLIVESRSRKDGSRTSNRYTLILEAFTGTAKKAAKAVKQGFSQAVDMGKHFIESKVKPIKPTSCRIGEQAWLELSEKDQQTVTDRLTSKQHPTLQKQIADYGLDSGYVQKALFNEVQQLKREQSKARHHKSTLEKLTDRSWAEKPDVQAV